MAEGVDLSKTLAGGSEELFDICCSPCSEDGISTEAEKYCVDCELYYCGKCLIYHNKIPSSRGHQIVNKSQADAGITKTPLPTQRYLKHHTKYCADHDVVCCDTCFPVKHRTCLNINILPDVARGIKVEEQKINRSYSEFKEEIKEEKLAVGVGAEKKKDPELPQYTATFSGKYKINESPCEVTAACILDNKSLILFDNTNCVLKRLNLEDFKIIDKLKLQWLSYSICSVGSEEVAVAFWFIRKIQLVSVGRTMTLTRSFSTDYYCRGVAFNDVSEEFYVSNNSNQVKVYDKKGKLMKYDRDGEGRFMFTAACNVAWSEDKAVLYVTDSIKGLIALSMSGELLWTFTDSELKNANGICVLPGDVILVSGVNSHNVIQVDKRGKKIGTLLGAGDSLNKPYALAFDRNRSRLIVGHYSKEIQVYNLTPTYKFNIFFN